MDELLFEYIDKFHENFPMFLFRTKTEEEINEIIKQCIDSGKHYEAELDENANY